MDGLAMSVRGVKQTLQPGGLTPSFTRNGPHADQHPIATNSDPHDGTLPNNVRDQRRIGSAYGWRASQAKY